jgi:DNA repair protein RadC
LKFDERDAIGLLLDIAKCPGDREWITELLLTEFGSLKGVLEAREEQLLKVDGIGRHTSILIRTIVEFVRLWERITMEQMDRIGNSFEAEKYCKSLLEGLRNEQFYVVCLNSQCRILGQRKISEGSLGEVSAYPRMVLETALNYNAHSVLLCHNHPGGTNAPSNEDISSTKTLQKLLNGVGILVLDHIIVNGINAYSMIQHGDIDYHIR